MDDFEDRLADLLVDSVPEPPRELDAGDIRQLARPRWTTATSRLRRVSSRRNDSTRASRRRARIAVAGAVIVAVVLALGALVLTNAARRLGSSNPPPSAPHPSTAAARRIAALGDAGWQLTSLIDRGQRVPFGSQRPVFRFKDSAATDNFSDAAVATIRDGHIRLGPFANGLVAGWPAPPRRSNEIYRLLQGALSWSITGNVLTMTGATVTARFHHTAVRDTIDRSLRRRLRPNCNGDRSCPAPESPPVALILTVAAKTYRLGEGQANDVRLPAGHPVAITVRLLSETRAPISHLFLTIGTPDHAGIDRGRPDGNLVILAHHAGRLADGQPIHATWTPTALYNSRHLDLGLVYAITGPAGSEGLGKTAADVIVTG